MLNGLCNRLSIYARLIRIDKPVGIFLLLWPTLWALWMASEGLPDAKIFFIYLLGTFLMRSAGCAINDYADREFDPLVKRTAGRPIANEEIAPMGSVNYRVRIVYNSFRLGADAQLINNKVILLSDVSCCQLSICKESDLNTSGLLRCGV